VNRLRQRGALNRLEPNEGKLSRSVLRGGSGSNAASLPDLVNNWHLQRAYVIHLRLPWIVLKSSLHEW